MSRKHPANALVGDSSSLSAPPDAEQPPPTCRRHVGASWGRPRGRVHEASATRKTLNSVLALPNLALHRAGDFPAPPSYAAGGLSRCRVPKDARDKSRVAEMREISAAHIAGLPWPLASGVVSLEYSLVDYTSPCPSRLYRCILAAAFVRKRPDMSKIGSALVGAAHRLLNMSRCVAAPFFIVCVSGPSKALTCANDD